MTSLSSHAILCLVTACALLTGVTVNPQAQRRRHTASGCLHAITVTLCLESSLDQNLIFVFVLYYDGSLEIPLNYLWRLPRALVYLSDEDIVPRDREREIVISWERDTDFTSDPTAMKYWHMGRNCGHRDADCATAYDYPVQHFRLEKRVLLQIREWSPTDHPKEPLSLVQHKLDNNPSYFEQYRATFIMLRRENEDTLLLAITVGRTGRIFSKWVLELDQHVWMLDHVRKVFQPLKVYSNTSDHITLHFQHAFFIWRGWDKRIQFKSCDRADKAYVYAYEYLPVRLAVPLPWQTQLISNLPKYLTLEVPLTLLSLLALPMVLSIRRHRTLHPTFSTWRTVYHLLSGDGSNSLISPVEQTTLILLVGGMVSLLLQYPINLLKGEVVSSSYEQRVQPSTCVVDSCHFSGMRDLWYYHRGLRDMPNYIGRLDKGDRLKDSITESKLKEGCHRTSISSSGMLNWTSLAFLTQYITICDDPELIRMQLRKWSKNLRFELIPGSHAGQPMCPFYVEHAGQVEPRRHYEISRWILTHGLLKYPHVKSSLYDENRRDQMFWYENVFIMNSSGIKAKIESAIRALEEGYVRYRMLEHEVESGAIKPEELRAIFRAFLSTIILIIVGVLLRYSFSFVRRQQVVLEEGVNTALSDEREDPVTSKDFMDWVRIAGEVMLRNFHLLRKRAVKVVPEAEAERAPDLCSEQASVPNEESPLHAPTEPSTVAIPSQRPDSGFEYFGSVEYWAVDGEAAAAN